MAEGLNVEIGVTLDRLTKQLASAEQRMIRAAKRSEQEFQRRNKGAADSFRQIDAAAGRTSSLIGRLGGTIAGAFVGGFAFGAVQQGFSALNQSIRSTITEMGDLADASDRIGVGIEDLQGLQSGFKLAGVEANELNAALEQFSRRIGDAATGGAFAKELDRFNIALRDQQGEIRPTLDLLKDYATQLATLPDAQQLAAAQDAFGRSGLALVNGLEAGGAGLQKFIDDAKEAGTVIDEELVRKAEEIGDRFDELSRRLGVFWQTQILQVADFVSNLTDAKVKLDELVINPSQLGQIDPEADLSGERQAVEDYALALEQLQAEAQALSEELLTAGASIRTVVGEADGSQISNLGIEFSALGTKLAFVSAEFEAGRLTGEEYRAELERIEGQSGDTFAAIDDIDSLGFGNVISRLGGLGATLARVAGIAAATARAVASIGASSVPDAPGPDGARRERLAIDGAARIQSASNNRFISEQTRINGLTREQIALEREVAGVRADALEDGAALSEQQINLLAQERLAAEAARAAAGKGASGGGKAGGGGGSSKPRKDEVAELLAQGQQQIAQLELEAEMLGKTGEQALFLKTQYELLAEAKQKGLDLDAQVAESGLTLRQEIDAQAASIAALATAYDMAKEKAEFFEDITQQLKDGIVDSIVAGESFKGVLAGIAKALAKAALEAALFGTGPLASLFGGNMVGTGALSFLGFSGGGFTGPGGKYEPKGIVHGGEYVFSKAAVQRIGVGNLEAMHRSLKGYAAGGMVGGAAAMPSAASPQVQVVVIDSEEKFGEYLAANPRAEREVMSIVKRNGG